MSPPVTAESQPPVADNSPACLQERLELCGARFDVETSRPNPMTAGGLGRESGRSYLQAHAIDLSPCSLAATSELTEGQIEFRRQNGDCRGQFYAYAP